MRFVEEKEPGLVLNTDLALRLIPHIKNLRIETELTVERYVQNLVKLEQIIYGSDVYAIEGTPSQSSTCPMTNSVLEGFLDNGFVEVECRSREIVYEEAMYETGVVLVLNIRAKSVCAK